MRQLLLEKTSGTTESHSLARKTPGANPSTRQIHAKLNALLARNNFMFTRFLTPDAKESLTTCIYELSKLKEFDGYSEIEKKVALVTFRAEYLLRTNPSTSSSTTTTSTASTNQPVENVPTASQATTTTLSNHNDVRPPPVTAPTLPLPSTQAERAQSVEASDEAIAREIFLIGIEYASTQQQIICATHAFLYPKSRGKYKLNIAKAEQDPLFYIKSTIIEEDENARVREVITRAIAQTNQKEVWDKLEPGNPNLYMSYMHCRRTSRYFTENENALLDKIGLIIKQPKFNLTIQHAVCAILLNRTINSIRRKLQASHADHKPHMHHEASHADHKPHVHHEPLQTQPEYLFEAALLLHQNGIFNNRSLRNTARKISTATFSDETSVAGKKLIHDVKEQLKLVGAPSFHSWLTKKLPPPSLGKRNEREEEQEEQSDASSEASDASPPRKRSCYPAGGPTLFQAGASYDDLVSYSSSSDDSEEDEDNDDDVMSSASTVSLYSSNR